MYVTAPNRNNSEFHILLDRSDVVLAELKAMRDGPKPIDTAKYTLHTNELKKISDLMAVTQARPQEVATW